MQHLIDARALLRHADVANAFADWLRDCGDDLIDAAALLGGPKWAARAARVVDAISAHRDPTGSLQDLRALRRLLNLELVDELTSVEAGRFAAIHPDDPRADSARLCAEALERGVNAVEALAKDGLRAVREAV